MQSYGCLGVGVSGPQAPVARSAKLHKRMTSTQSRNASLSTSGGLHFTVTS